MQHALRAAALGLLDGSPFMPPHRPQGPARRSKGNDGVFHLIRSFRSALAVPLDEIPSPQLPRLSRYPY